MTNAAMRKMSALLESETAHGDVQCLNCGRTLGKAVRKLSSGATTIRPVRAGEEIMVERGVGRGLRCKRCGGRAFIEFDERSASVA